MLNPSIPWENAIRTRRSVRKYKLDPLSQEHYDALSQFVQALTLPFEHDIECRFFKADPTKKLYFSMSSPPDNMAFLASTDVLSLSKVGFLGELILIYANSLGISTCWYGHYHLEELQRLMPHLPSPDCLKTSNMGFGYSKGEAVEGRRAICVTPLGYHDISGLRLVDRMTETFISYKRKSLEELFVQPMAPSTLNEPLRYALDLARLAPSAANSQHWRFEISEDQSTVKIAMPPGYKHLKWEHPNVDIGICAAHFWIGLNLAGLRLRLSTPSVMLLGLTPSVTLTLEEGRAVWTFKL